VPLPSRVPESALSAMHLLYLHGFASSAHSSKAAYFRARAAERGVELLTPDFNEPNFERLTISRMMGQVSELMAGLDQGGVRVIGSSLGAFVAVQVALQQRRVDRLVLLAPALDFSGNRLRDLGDRGLDEWRRTDTLNVFHYGFGRMMPIRFGLYEDAARYNAMDARIEIPIQIFQGTRDVAVSPETVRRWAAARSNVELHLLDDDHQLIATLDTIWQLMSGFLGLENAGRVSV
jgi:pimeloyl-ACP methyl ester carboxylesterase